MTPAPVLLAAACALLLSACGGGDEHAPAATPSTPAAATPTTPAATTPPAPPQPVVDDKVDSASVPEAPWGQVPADPATPARGESGESAGNAAPTPDADLPPTVPTEDPSPVEGDGEGNDGQR